MDYKHGKQELGVGAAGAYRRRSSGRPNEEVPEKGSHVGVDHLDSIQEPGQRYLLKDIIGYGVCGDVYEAIDQHAGNRKVAVKVQNLTSETQSLIIEEYKVLRDFAGHPNLPDFYGIYRNKYGKRNKPDEIWFVMELCEGGSVMDLVRGLLACDKTMREEHIAYILKEVIKALLHLHENNVMHRDVRGSNIVITKEGEVRLVDFGLSKLAYTDTKKRRTCIGSPSWMAPEIVSSHGGGSDAGYGSRADVWAIGITAIELAEGRAPFEDMHPTRALFQIVRNPPPGLNKPANWSANFNDFISECLEKNPDNRPFMAEIIEHPFLADVPMNDYLLSQEIKALAMDVCETGKAGRKPEVMVRKGFLKTNRNEPAEPMFVEDLAALEAITEEAILDELHERLQQGSFHTFVGDILLILNPNEQHDIYGPEYHTKYNCKSRSDNAPHIYSVADSAYQDVLHNEEPQHILLAGESNSGKTTNMIHIVEHLMYLGKSLQDNGPKVMKAIQLIHAFSNAATPLNPNSTRCVLQIQTTFGTSGKASGAIFWLYQLEKWRVSTHDKNQSNFHVFYYFYDSLDASGKLKQYNLPPGRRVRYLRILDKGGERKRSFKVRNDPQGNAKKFEDLIECFREVGMEKYCETIWKILAAILLLGEIRFVQGSHGEADMNNNETANKVADLLELDQKKFCWALINYCLVAKGAAIRRKHTCEEAKEARDVLANTIYQRLVDWIVNMINFSFTGPRAHFGDKFSISIMDLFGFECFGVNQLEQLVVNTMNEQMQCYYNQRVFAWEMQEEQEEDIPVRQLHFYDNKDAVDQLMNKDKGLFHIIDDASRLMQDTEYVLEKIKSRGSVYVKALSSHEFTVAHYTGKLTYNASEIAEKNRDFLPPEMIETMRLSALDIVRQAFTGKLTKAGSLTLDMQHPKISDMQTSKGRWGVLVQDTTKLRKYNTASRGQFSQTRKMRTCTATFRATSLEILKNLAVGGGSSGVQFVRCIRSDLEGAPKGFYRDVVRQQIRALAVLDTARARQRGYPHRIAFEEFLRRYKFLAFDFDENVELTKDNCRLLLIRLKMEGWILGKSKVFLKYYNEEYLSRLYETQVKKIVKVQCMMRAFLARRNMVKKISKMKKEIVKQASIQRRNTVDLTEDQAAVMIQKAYRGHIVRKEVKPLLKGELDQETKDFIKFYSSKWRSKSMYQVLLQYRAARYQDLVQFCQQVHLYNQAIAGALETTNERITLEKIDPGIKASVYLGDTKPLQVYKLPFDIHQELPFFDTSYMNDPPKKSNAESVSSMSDDEHEAWDAPLRRQAVPWASNGAYTKDVEVQTTNSPHRSAHRMSASGQSLIYTPFSRDPNVPIQCPPEDRPKTATLGSQRSNIRSPMPLVSAHDTRSNTLESTGSIRSRKKVRPPPIPINQAPPPPTRSYNSNYNTADMKSKNIIDISNSDFELEDRMNRNVPSSRVNPIQELHMLGRKNNNVDDDEPPFNFQAMLRKTPHQRASMKRNPVYDSYAPSPQPIAPNPSIPDRAQIADTKIVNRSTESRRESAEWSPNEMIRMSEKYGREEPWVKEGTDDQDKEDLDKEDEEFKEEIQAIEEKEAEQENANNKEDEVHVDEENEEPKSITTEIAPGITVEGYVAEL